MTLDPKHRCYFVARQSEVLRKIGEEFGGVVVTFSRKGVTSDNVSLKGAKNCIEGAMVRIKEIVKDLVEQVTLDCEIDQQFHRTVMGTKSSKVLKITAEFNVQIKFPNKALKSRANPNTIRITGKKGNCEAVAELTPGSARHCSGKLRWNCDRGALLHPS